MGIDSVSDWETIVLAVSSPGIVFGFKKINTALVVLGNDGLLLQFQHQMKILQHIPWRNPSGKSELHKLFHHFNHLVA